MLKVCALQSEHVGVGLMSSKILCRYFINSEYFFTLSCVRVLVYIVSVLVHLLSAVCPLLLCCLSLFVCDSVLLLCV